MPRIERTDRASGGQAECFSSSSAIDPSNLDSCLWTSITSSELIGSVGSTDVWCSVHSVPHSHRGNRYRSVYHCERYTDAPCSRRPQAHLPLSGSSFDFCNDVILDLYNEPDCSFVARMLHGCAPNWNFHIYANAIAEYA